jgi:hypothetical protein
MSLTEGLRRMKVVGRSIFFAGLALDVVGLAGIFVDRMYGFPPVMLIFGAFGIYASIFGAIVWLATWIAEGFLLGPHPPSQ